MSIKACILAICALALACRPVSNATNCSVKETASQTLSTPTIEFNTTKEYALCFESEPGEINGIIRFNILQTNNCRILEKGTLRPGYIKWISPTEIELLDLPGALEGDKDLTNFKKIISIKTIQPK
jgi:hypothetical protein